MVKRLFATEMGFMSAYEEGRDAQRRGDFPEVNPYDERDAQWDEWEDGWYDELKRQQTSTAV
jgi:hypothetical protein